jgi:tRNA-dihydrouridine synthase 3
LKRIEPHKEFYHDKNAKPAAEPVDEEEAFNDLAAGAQPVSKGDVPGESEADDVPMRPEEKRRLNWEGGLYLAPLTTVGNLVGFSLQFSPLIPYSPDHDPFPSTSVRSTDES